MLLRRIATSGLTLSLFGLSLYSQNLGGYVTRTIAGITPKGGDGGPATSALLETPQAVAVDSAGNMYIADSGNSVIRKVTRAGVISIFAPSFTTYAYDIKLDSTGNLYVAANNRVYKLTPAGAFTTVAGTGTAGYGGDGGPATAALFNGVYSIALDNSNNLYICDYGNHRVRKVTANGTIQTVAGSNGKGYGGDGVQATSALLNYPEYVAVDGAGNLYIGDSNNYRIRMVGADGMISTIVGNGTCCNSPNGGLGTAAFVSVGPMAADSAGNLYFWDYQTSKLRMVSGGILSGFAGSGKDGFGGDGDSATAARFSGVAGVAVDSSNNVYVVDSNNERVRMISSGTITTVAGKAHFAGDGSPAASAILHRPRGVAVAVDGTVYFTDTYNHRIRRIANDGTISTIAGTGDPGFGGDGSPATAALLAYPDFITIDSAGNLFFVDQSDFRVRKISASGIISTVAGNGQCCTSNDSVGAVNSPFYYINGIAVDGSGNLFLSELYNNKVKKVSPAGGLSTYAGNGASSFGGDGAQAPAAQLRNPADLAVDGVGNLYINDSGNYRIRKVDRTTGGITTIAGNGNCCSAGDGAAATAAAITAYGMVADSVGGLWFVDYLGVRYVSKDGTITRVAGYNTIGFGGDDAPAGPNSVFYYARGIALAAAGDLIIADTGNSRIRKLQPNDPVKLEIVSGNSQTGVTGTALKAIVVKVTGRANFPVPGTTINFQVTSGSATLSAASSATDANGQAGIGVTPTKAGNVTVTATAGSLTATFTATATDPVIVPVCNVTVTSVTSLSDFGGASTFAPGSWLEIKGSNLSQTTRPWAGADFSGANAPTSLDGVSVSINGNKAYVFYVSPGQIDVQAPADTATGDVPLTVTTPSCTSKATVVSEAAIAPGLLAPASFNIGGKQYLVAQYPDGVFVGNVNLIQGAAFRPAVPGDTLTVFGIGFGSVTPASAPGTVASGTTAIPNLTINFGTTAAKVVYGGLAPGAVGEYQFVFTVPNVADGDYPIVFQAGLTKSSQTVYLTVHK